MIVDINFVVLDDIFSSVSKKKIVITEISEDKISEVSQPAFISDDIRIYKKDNLLYIFLDSHENIDNLLNILKQEEIYENVKGVVLSYKKTIKYDINEHELKNLVKKLIKYGDLIYLKLLKKYDKDFAKDMTKVVLLSDHIKQDDKTQKINDDTILGFIDEGIKKLRQRTKEFGTSLTNFIKDVISKLI